MVRVPTHMTGQIDQLRLTRSPCASRLRIVLNMDYYLVIGIARNRPKCGRRAG